MGFRYRKSIKLGPFRLNLSKRGAGVSVGVKGARVGIGPRGVRTTLSVPGTGISYVKESRLKGNPPVLKAPRVQPARQKAQPGQIAHTTVPKPYKGTRWLVGTFIGLLMLGSNLAFGILVTIICGFRYHTVRQRLKQQSMEVTEPPQSC